jgi:phosphotransferase system  glucose/maltose/N-acetylglucosamine-specific IIC component
MTVQRSSVICFIIILVDCAVLYSIEGKGLALVLFFIAFYKVPSIINTNVENDNSAALEIISCSWPVIWILSKQMGQGYIVISLIISIVVVFIMDTLLNRCSYLEYMKKIRHQKLTVPIICVVLCFVLVLLVNYLMDNLMSSGAVLLGYLLIMCSGLLFRGISFIL